MSQHPGRDREQCGASSAVPQEHAPVEAEARVAIAAVVPGHGPPSPIRRRAHAEGASRETVVVVPPDGLTRTWMPVACFAGFPPMRADPAAERPTTAQRPTTSRNEV